MTGKTMALGMALISYVTFAGCHKKQSAKNVCPIDGQPPQWSGGRKGNSCEYFHYSGDTERHSHSWWADCKLDQTEQASPPPSSQH